MSRFQSIGNYVYEKGERIGCTTEEAADALACKLNAYQMRIERLKAENARLRAASFVTAVPVEQYERLRKAGDAMEEVIWLNGCLSGMQIKERAVKVWNAAKEGKQS